MKNLSAVLILMICGTAVLAASPDDVVGFWLTTDERSTVEIYREGDRFHGKFVALKEPLNEHGQIKTDRYNPDVRRRTDPLLGLQLVWGFSFKGGSTWAGGRIYDPDNGKTYHCRMTLKDKTLTVRGSLDRWGLAGRTVKWTRKTGD